VNVRVASVAATVERARAGSREAFDELVRAYCETVQRCCLRIVRDGDVAADLTQRTFIRALENLHELRDPQLFPAWLFRIAGNMARNHLRDDARLVRSEPEELPAPATGPDLEAADDSRLLLHAVERLPRRQRQVVKLRVYEERRFADIAVRLQTTTGAAKVSYHVAVKKLRHMLAAAHAA
jgi:RNA polymerase sigma-70 factor (ECF subfamily)